VSASVVNGTFVLQHCDSLNVGLQVQEALRDAPDKPIRQHIASDPTLEERRLNRDLFEVLAEREVGVARR
jgi:hypothetical protein